MPSLPAHMTAIAIRAPGGPWQRTLLGHEHIRCAGRADRYRGHLGGQRGHGKSPWLTRSTALA